MVYTNSDVMNKPKDPKVTQFNKIEIFIYFLGNTQETTVYFCNIRWINQCQGYIVLAIDISYQPVIVLPKVVFLAVYKWWLRIICNWFNVKNEITINLIWILRQLPTECLTMWDILQINLLEFDVYWMQCLIQSIRRKT